MYASIGAVELSVEVMRQTFLIDRAYSVEFPEREGRRNEKLRHLVRVLGWQPKREFVFPITTVCALQASHVGIAMMIVESKLREFDREYLFLKGESFPLFC